MLRALRTAALGMKAQQTGVDNIAHNLANANTTGYKRSNVIFQDLLYQNVQAHGQAEGEGGPAPATLQIGHGAAPVATMRNFTQGGLEQTGNSFDLAINGDGFFQVRMPDGTVSYSRDGSLTISDDGYLMTQTGLQLEPDVSIPMDATEVHISQDGVVKVRFNGEADHTEIGQIELARFSNPSGLMAEGGNLYSATQASGEPAIATPGRDGLGVIRQGYLEVSNVEVVQEMVNLITAQRAYEINSKMVTTSEEMLQVANNVKR
ncbi:MAG: flagellar basal-body rod protein FlgG [Rhodothermales bacterium]